jgi:hypothetical protein
MKKMYPYSPKSTAQMKPGQFWGIHLHDGTFACGVVLAARLTPEGKRDSRQFLAGLLNWRGNQLPSSDAITGCPVVAHGFAHIRTITENGADILGESSPWWQWPEAVQDTDAIHTWGYGFIVKLAEKLKK